MSNLVIIRIFQEGGLVMWPILLTSIVALTVIVERFNWWRTEGSKRDPAKLDKVFALLENDDLKSASSLAGKSDDSILRVLGFALNQRRGSLHDALQVFATIEMERAGRFMVVLDTIVTLAPLLGLLGTVTGLMKAFFKLGDTELSESAISGGIAEALIATACGLGIAIICLIFLNYFSAKVDKFRFELETACSHAELHAGAPVSQVSLP
jgi:biopolymer transport protein ExbB